MFLLENIIKSTTDSIADAYMYPGLLGTGRVNAYKAVQAACATVSPTVNFTNQTVTANTTVTSCGDIYVRNVTVTNGAKLTLKAAGATVIGSNFTVDPGSQPEIK